MTTTPIDDSQWTVSTDPRTSGLNAAIFGDKVAMDAIAILRSQGWSAEDVRNAMFALSQHRWL